MVRLQNGPFLFGLSFMAFQIGILYNKTTTYHTLKKKKKNYLQVLKKLNPLLLNPQNKLLGKIPKKDSV